MTPATLDFTIYQGITFGPVLINCLDAADAAVDITGWTLQADVRRTLQDGVVEFNLGASITNGATGEITLTLTDEETDLLDAGSYVWDLVLENLSGQRLGPFAVGRVRVKPVSSRPS
jgi:hypothetical protein